MPRVTWALHQGFPCIELDFVERLTRVHEVRRLLGDTGAGSRNAPFELIGDTAELSRFGGRGFGSIDLGGAIRGIFPLHSFWVEIPTLGFAKPVPAVAVPSGELPPGLDGIAGFRFLNRFTYGNFGDPDKFGLETP